MESTPTPAEAEAALAAAEASRTRMAEGIRTPSWFSTSISAATAIQIATTALGFGTGDPWVLVAGVVLFTAVAGLQLVRFRRLNGAWVGRFASRVVLGTGTTASLSYGVALGVAIWAAYGDRWWLMALFSLAGGVAYGLSGRRWMRAYRAEPAVHGRGEPAAWLILIAVTAVAGLVLLVINA